MPNPYVLQKFKIISPYAIGNPNMPTYQQRIQDTFDLGQINMIIIDGRAQVGKSTLAEEICRIYDPSFTTIFTIEDFLNYLDKAKELWRSGKWKFGRWLLVEEVQLETPRQSFWTEKNFIINSITSSFGFLKNHLVMTLPNVAGLQEITLTNISMRITIANKLKKQTKQVIRRGYIKIPKYNEVSKKFRWLMAEIISIPELRHPDDYMEKKVHNFFDIQLEKWHDKIKKKKDEFTTVEEYAKQFE